MGVLSIILGLALMGAVVDVVVENDVATAVQQPLTVAGTTQHVSPPVLAAIAFAAGAFAVVLIVLGIRRLRHAGRKQLQERIRTLQDENARLHTQRNLAEHRPGPRGCTAVASEHALTPRQPAPAEPQPDQPVKKW